MCLVGQVGNTELIEPEPIPDSFIQWKRKAGLILFLDCVRKTVTLLPRFVSCFYTDFLLIIKKLKQTVQ